jgi:anti-anti-sigma factor
MTDGAGTVAFTSRQTFRPSEGELDITTVCDLRDELRHAYAAAIRTVVLDLSALAFIDVSGVRLLLDARAEADASRLVLAVRLGPTTRRMVDLMDVRDGVET